MIRRLSRLVRLALLAAVVLAGCSSLTPPDMKKEANERWADARARVLFGVAREHLRTGQLRQAMARVQEALALAPEMMEAHVLRTRILIEQGHYRVALAELDELVKLQPKSSELRYLTGCAQERNGDLEEALASYRLAHALDDQSTEAVTAATEVLVHLHRVSEAQVYIESYLNDTTADPAMCEIAGRVAAMLNQHERAVRYYREACDLDPQNPSYREALGTSQFQAGQFEAALQSLQQLQQLREGDTPAWVRTMIGDCHLACNRPREARDAYYAASELGPEEPGVWANLAKAALALDDLPRAILSARHALTLQDDHLDAALALGFALLKDGQTASAEQVLTRAATQHPDSAMAQCLLGRAAAAAGRDDDARAHYLAAVRAEPDDPLARELAGAPAQSR